jgi:predicted MFS family arabinose efflux permease
MRRWSLLRNRDFMLLWSGEGLSELGSQTSTVAYPLLVLALTGSPAKAGVVGLAKWLPLAVFALPAGALADRVDRKRLMIACDALRAVAVLSIVLALWLGSPAYGQVVAIAFFDGALFVTSYIAERGALRQVVADDQLQDAVAQNEARTFGATIVGPPLGGVLFAAGRALPFLADAVSYLCSTTAIWLTRSEFQTSSAAGKPPRRRLRAEVADGFGWLWRRPFFRTAALLFAAGNPLFTGLYLLAVLLATDNGASSGEVGAMFAIIGVGGVLGAIAAAPLRRRLTPRAVIAGEDWLLVALILLLLAAHDALLIGALVAAAEFGTPLTNSVVSGARIAATPDHLQGRVQASSALIAMSLAWLGPLAVGVAFQHAGPTATVLLAGGWALALAVAATAAPALRVDPATSDVVYGLARRRRRRGRDREALAGKPPA